MAQLLIVDDDSGFREGLAETLLDLGHRVDEAASAEAALQRLRTEPGVDCVFLDYRMPGTNGLELLEKIRSVEGLQHLPVVLLTAYATSDNTVKAMRLGAFEHLIKPVGRAQIAELLTRIAFSRGGPGESPVALPDGFLMQGIAAGTTQLLGSSPALRAVQKQIGRASASGSTVLITGETGTGKEVAARVLHDASARHAGPFVTVNCAAIPESLLESELFGHARGAFTGAVVDRVGRLVRAHGGSLFLDEIGDMPLPMQVKLLRALQEREVTPVGSNKTISIDIRVIAATHRNLHDEMGQGRFREDLFYRLNVIPIHLPPLRERQGDILPLAEHFLRHGDDEGQAAGRRLSPPAQRLILDHPWPGNVRELQNAMQRVSALSAGPVITAGDLGFLGDSLARLPDPSPPAAVGLTLPEAVARLERELIADALTKAAGNRADAARRLGISRQTLYAKLALYGLDL